MTDTAYAKLYGKLKRLERAYYRELMRQFGKNAIKYRDDVKRFDPATKQAAIAFFAANDDMKVYREARGKRQRKSNYNRHSNPAPRKRRGESAARLYEEFTGHAADHAVVVEVPDYPKELTVIGPCVAIAYECVRDGEKAQYQHEFKKKAAPLLCSSPDGRQLFLIGGSFEFRDTGINDL